MRFTNLPPWCTSCLHTPEIVSHTVVHSRGEGNSLFITEPPPIHLPLLTSSCLPLRYAEGSATWSDMKGSPGSKCWMHRDGSTQHGSPFVCGPASRTKILSKGSAAARRPATTQAVVPPGMEMSDPESNFGWMCGGEAYLQRI